MSVSISTAHNEQLLHARKSQQRRQIHNQQEKKMFKDSEIAEEAESRLTKEFMNNVIIQSKNKVQRNIIDDFYGKLSPWGLSIAANAILSFYNPARNEICQAFINAVEDLYEEEHSDEERGEKIETLTNLHGLSIFEKYLTLRVVSNGNHNNRGGSQSHQDSTDRAIKKLLTEVEATHADEILSGTDQAIKLVESKLNLISGQTAAKAKSYHMEYKSLVQELIKERNYQFLFQLLLVSTAAACRCCDEGLKSQNSAFEAFEGLGESILRSHGIRTLITLCDVSRKAIATEVNLGNEFVVQNLSDFIQGLLSGLDGFDWGKLIDPMAKRADLEIQRSSIVATANG